MADEPAEERGSEAGLAPKSLPGGIRLTGFFKLYSSMCVIS